MHRYDKRFPIIKGMRSVAQWYSVLEHGIGCALAKWVNGGSGGSNGDHGVCICGCWEIDARMSRGVYDHALLVAMVE